MTLLYESSILYFSMAGPLSHRFWPTIKARRGDHFIMEAPDRREAGHFGPPLRSRARFGPVPFRSRPISVPLPFLTLTISVLVSKYV